VSHADSRDGDQTRRDFLFIATGTMGAVGVAAAVWPLIDQMNPSADVLALASIEVDVSGVDPGTQITVQWRGKPVFIRHRTQQEIEQARSVELDDLKDSLARNDNLSTQVPATDANRALGDTGEWLVMIGICTHLGCVPLGNGAGDFGGWFCPCHGSLYDISGRVRRSPAPRNLEVPEYAFLDDAQVRIG
jgi:ubiquinol-cytochrome c reductase iron-sulfur subunit